MPQSSAWSAVIGRFSQIGPRGTRRSDQTRQVPGAAAVSGESDACEGGDELGTFGRQHDVGGVDIPKSPAGRPSHGRR